MSSLDNAYASFVAIRDQARDNIDAILTEEDAKVQIITRVVTECLGWSFSDIGNERRHESGYSDYLISKSNQNILIVEAKRLGRVPITVTDKAVQKNLKLNGPGLSAANDGISQAASYAQPNGVPIAVLTDGDAWIVFKPSIAGTNYLEKQAIVFPSLDAVTAKFSLFYDLLGQEPCSRKVYNQIFDELHNTRVLLTSPLVPAIEASGIYRQQKSKLSFDLEPVFDNFFSRMTGGDDPNLILDCFVETQESRIADHSLEKMTARVLGNINIQGASIDKDLSDYLSSAVELDAGESVFIVGPTGAGKSTFIDRFFKKTLSEETRTKCVPIRLNFLEASGSIEPTLQWITENLIENIEGSLFDGGNPTWEELRGLYFSDYTKQRKGTGAKLYERDKEKFQEDFGQYMAKKVDEDREGYLRRLLSDIVHNRKKLPVIIADNTDEFPSEVKEAVFQYIQSLRVYSKHCILIFPITDKSAWSFTKTDIYSIYQSKSFFLPTPPPREVFRRRIEYLKGKIEPTEGDVSSRKYLTDRNINISISNLSSFADVIEDAFVNDEYAAKILGELSNYNIRRTLRLARRVIKSPVFGIDDLIVAFASGTATFNRRGKFLNALMKGDYNFFNKNDIDAGEVVAVFQVDRKFNQSPLLQMRVLAMLESALGGATNVDDRHLSVGSISDYFQAIGSSEAAVDTAILRLIDSNLVEPFDPSERGLSASQRIAISFSGRVHYRLATNNQIFFEQMALTTEISNSDVASMISSAFNSKIASEERLATVRTLFAQHLIERDEMEMSVPVEGKTYESQRELLELIRGFATTDDRKRKAQDSPTVRTSDDQVKSGVIGTVDFYDSQRGFGFVDVSDIGERCFVGADAVARSGFSTLNDGDDILCDVGPSPKGPQVVLIHDLQNKPHEVTLLECVVVRLVPDRLYGFASVFGRSDDALFHFSLLPAEQAADIEIGMRFEAEVRINSKNGLQQIRRIERILEKVS